MPGKKYSKKQKKLAAVAKPRKKITGADFKKLKAGKKKRALPKRGNRTKTAMKRKY
jgi:hypothetical protein